MFSNETLKMEILALITLRFVCLWFLKIGGSLDAAIGRGLLQIGFWSLMFGDWSLQFLDLKFFGL